MKHVDRSSKITRSILTLVLLGVSATFFSCGIFEDENNQPWVQIIKGSTITADQALTLAVNSSRTVVFYIRDDDDYDRHTISAGTEDSTVATVSVNRQTYDTILTITGMAIGTTNVTLTVKDNSGEDNAISTPVVFNVTVIEPYVVASTTSLLTDISLDRSVVTLTLVGLVYDRVDNFTNRDSVTVSGIGGLKSSVTKISDTEVRFELSYSKRIEYASDAGERFQAKFVDDIGNMHSDAALTFTVNASAIAGYDGPPLTAQIPVADTIEIEGPWLWMVVPTDPNAGSGVSTEIDSIASASNNTVTETDVATRGVNEGDIIGQFQWTSGSIGYTHGACEVFCVRELFGRCATLCWWNNVNDTLNTIGFGVGDNMNAHTAYALINLVSSSDQDDAIIGVVSSDAIKIWLNGEIVHREDATVLECRSIDVPLASDPTVCTPDSSSPTGYSIPVKLNAGDNLLLVKVRQHGDYWGMVLGLAADFTTEVPNQQ